MGEFGTPSILCDTKDQLQSIVDAFDRGVDAGQARYNVLYGIQNGKHEPVCAITALRNIVAGESVDMGTLSFAGGAIHGWAVHVGNGAGDGYYLFLESNTEAMKNTI